MHILPDERRARNVLELISTRTSLINYLQHWYSLNSKIKQKRHIDSFRFIHFMQKKMRFIICIWNAHLYTVLLRGACMRSFSIFSILKFKYKIDTHLYAWKCITKWHSHWQFIVFVAAPWQTKLEFLIWNVACMYWKIWINEWHRTKLTFHLNKSRRRRLWSIDISVCADVHVYCILCYGCVCVCAVWCYATRINDK